MRQRPLEGRRTSRSTGTAALEMAVILPLLLLLVFGCVDYGRVAYYSMALENAVGCGSQYAATHRFTDDTFVNWEEHVREAVVDEMEGVTDFDRGSLSINVSIDQNNAAGVRATVSATYPFQTVVDWPGLPAYVPLRHQVSAWRYQ